MPIKTKTVLDKSMKALAAGGMVSLSVLSVLGLKAATAATATMPMIARLVAAIEVTVATSIDFGTLAIAPERAGRARIDPALNRLILDDNNSLSLAGGAPKVGRLVVRGATLPVAISIEDTAVQLTNGITNVTINNFNFVSANGGPKVTITPAAGSTTFTIPVGATLITKAGQASGTYTGTTRVFANFQ